MASIISYTVFYLLIAFVVVFAVMMFWFRDKYLKKEDEYLELADKDAFFSKKPSIMRHDERQLFDILMKLYNDKYYIFPQVKLTSLLAIKENVKDHDNVYRIIDHKSVDFTMYDRTVIAPVLAIELNGKSHLQLNKKNRDQMVKSILTKSGIQFAAIQVADTYDEGAIRQQLDPLLSHSS